MAALSEASYSDYLYWLGKKSWTAAQAALLFSGIDPDSFLAGSAHTEDRLSRRYQAFRSHKRLISSARKTKDLRTGIHLPTDWLAWARDKKLRIPEELFAAVNAKYPQDTKKRDAEKPIQMRERRTLLVLLAAFAQLAKVDLTKPSKAAGIVAKASQELGAPISQRTIEEHLKRISEAVERRTK